MTHDEMIYTSKSMKKFGGSFVVKLGELMPLADTMNLAKLEATFPEYMRKYGPESQFYKAAYDAENK